MNSPAKSLLRGVLGTLLSLWIGPAAASADQNLQLDEVMAGAFGRPELQLVELRLGSCEPRAWAGTARLAFFDGSDNEVGEFVFPADPTVAGCEGPGHPVLIASQAFAGLPGAPAPDFVMPPLLVPGSGKVCFQGLPGGEPANLCLSYGGFAGDSQQGSPGNAPPLLPTRICSVQRQALFGDFTEPSFNEDFGLGEPRPAGQKILIPGRFQDVSLQSPFGRFAEALFNAGVTAGCGNGNFCPQATVTRDQMAVFLLRAKEGSSFTPPACTTPVFGDVPCSNPFAPWINELAARGITGGCGGAGMGNYCPGGAVTREQMAVFLLLTLEGAGFAPPACTVPVFNDVPCSNPFAPWINELAARGITGGCGGGNYCPGGTLPREQMAVLLSSAFLLPVPSFDCSGGPLPLDDHGDVPGSATPFPLNTPLTGNLEASSDQDVFSFAAAAGEVFHAGAVLLNGGFQVPLTFLDAAGQDLGSNEVFQAPADGTFYVQVGPFGADSPRRYQLTLEGPFVDDHGNTPDEATPVVPVAALPGEGPGTAGRLELWHDVDVFSFPVQAGGLYAVELAGFRNLQLLILGPDGTTVLATGVPEPGGALDLDSTALFQAPVTGTIFASVGREAGFDVGPYTLRVRGPLSDPAGAVPLTIGVPAFGELPEGDADLFSFPAGAGQVFLVDADVLAGDFIVLEVLDTDGTTVLASDNARAVARVFAAPATGTFFVRLRSPELPSVYRVTVRGPFVDDHGNDSATATPLPVDGTELAGDIEVPGDVDVFQITVTEAGFYPVEVTELSPGLHANAFVSASHPFLEPGTYFVSVSPHAFSSPTGEYRISVTGPLGDDHGDTLATATLLPPGSPEVNGRIEVRGDVDVFAFDAVAGQRFRWKLTPDAPLPFGILFPVILEPDGVTQLFLVTNEFIVPSTGRYFVRVGGGQETGYRLTIGPVANDDHGNDPEDATLLTVDGPAVNGFHHLDLPKDLDFFAFDAAAGETLVIETSGLGPSSDTVIDLLGTDGFTLLDRDDDSAGALASRITFTFPSSGRYFVRTFQNQDDGVGPYQIAVRSQP